MLSISLRAASLSTLSLHSHFFSFQPEDYVLITSRFTRLLLQTCPRLMQHRKETGRQNVSGLDDGAYAIIAFNIG